MESEIRLAVFVTESNASTRPRVCTEQICGGTPTTTIIVQSPRSLRIKTLRSSAACMILVAEPTEAESAVVGDGVIGGICASPTRGLPDKQKVTPRPAHRTLAEQARSELSAMRREIEKTTPRSALAGPGREVYPGLAKPPALTLSTIVQTVEPGSEGDNIAPENLNAKPRVGDTQRDQQQCRPSRKQKNVHQGLRLTDVQALLLGTRARREEC